MSEGNAVARRDGGKVLDLTSAEASKKFLDAYSGRIGQMNPDQQSMFLMALGTVLGVRAELGEVILFAGKPYISLDGRIRLAHASGLLVGLDARPATSLERRNYGCGDGEALWVATAQRRGAAGKFTGWGHVRKDEKNPVTKTHPREMAKKRAKYDALRSAFPAAEQITPMHQQFIEEAEADIRAGKSLPYPALAALQGGDEFTETTEPDADEEGQEQAADAPSDPVDVPPAEGDPALPLGDTPKRRYSSRNAQEL